MQPAAEESQVSDIHMRRWTKLLALGIIHPINALIMAVVVELFDPPLAQTNLSLPVSAVFEVHKYVSLSHTKKLNLLFVLSLWLCSQSR